MVHTKQGTRTKLSLSQGREHTILHEDDGGEENPLADIVSHMSAVSVHFERGKAIGY